MTYISVSIGVCNLFGNFRNISIDDDPSPFFSAQKNSIFFRCECQWIEVFPLRRMDLELARLSAFSARSMGPRPQHLLALAGRELLKTGSIKSGFYSGGMRWGDIT